MDPTTFAGIIAAASTRDQWPCVAMTGWSQMPGRPPFRPEWAVAGPLVGAALPMRDAVPAVVDDARCGLLSCLQWSRTQWRQSMSCNTPLIVRRCRRGYLGARGPVVNPVLSGRLSGQSTMISRYRRHDHAGRPRCSGQHCPSLTGVAGHIASQRRSG
jgi:hypothetical protein